MGSEGKGNSDSVTTEPCRCDYLERASDEPSIPIQFDRQMQEYQIAHRTGDGHSVIYHCPWCGGTAPRSQRERHFAALTSEEIRRLERLTSPLRTPDDAVAAFGPPQEERERGVTIQHPATDAEPGHAESYRTLTFKALSVAADVVLVDYGVQGVKWQYWPKYIGPPDDAA